MNLLDSSFLCLDVGTSHATGIGVRMSSGRISASYIQSFESPDTAFAIKRVTDALESRLGIRFDSAYITGNFGPTELKIAQRTADWGKEHKITGQDIITMVSDMKELAPEFFPMHIIPLRYDLEDFANLATPIGQHGRQLSALFGIIAASRDGIKNVREHLRTAHMMGLEFSDPSFLIANSARPKKESSMLVDLGASATTVSIWTARGPVFIEKIPTGQSMLTDAIAGGLCLQWVAAERIKRENLSLSSGEMDRFTPASAKHEFTRADVNNLALPVFDDIIKNVHTAAGDAIEKYQPVKIYVYGGGANIPGIETALQNEFRIPIENIGAVAAAQACTAYVWGRIKPHFDAIAARRARRARIGQLILKTLSKLFKRQKKPAFLPIMPSTLTFDMRDDATYAKFRAGHISMIHIDIMDGLFVDRITSGIDELKLIRSKTDAHLSVHLMTENPRSWANSAAEAGADTIIISAGTYGVRATLSDIKAAGKRSGIAISPDATLDILKPVLRNIDEVLVMSAQPGASGQEFMPSALLHIKALAATRKKYGLKFKISVDCGINKETAKLCWAAGADFLISGSYLAKATDFPAAVQSLLRKN